MHPGYNRVAVLFAHIMPLVSVGVCFPVRKFHKVINTRAETIMPITRNLLVVLECSAVAGWVTRRDATYTSLRFTS